MGSTTNRVERMIIVVCRLAGMHNLPIADQWHVPAQGGFAGEAELFDRGGEARAQRADVFREDPVKITDLARCKIRSAGPQIQLRSLIVVLDGIQPVVDSLARVAQLQATLARTAGFFVISVEECSRVTARKCRTDKYALSPFAHHVESREIATGGRQTSLLPLELIEGA
ncbi:hypothetical protein D9M68_485220 [compost metagenome]